MSDNAIAQQIVDALLPKLKIDDPDAHVDVTHNSFGWISVRVVTTQFCDVSLPLREERIDILLHPMSLMSYPIAHYELLTPNEAAVQRNQPASLLPMWSDVLLAPDIPHRVIDEEEETLPSRPLIVTFYSFKGGVGRTTALGILARMLAAEKRRVVMLDFDLEAPGLSYMFPSAFPENQPMYGILDYLHQRYLTPDANLPPISECLYQVELPFRSEVYLVPAGEYNENYVHRLADLDVRLFYQRDANAMKQLIEDIVHHLNTPDVLLIDARTGFTEIGAVALLDLADIGIVCFSPTVQNYAGLDWILKAAKKQFDYRGKPDIRFLLTPIPPVDAIQRERWVAHAEDYIMDKWDIPPDLSVEDFHTDVSYNPIVNTVDDFAGEVDNSIVLPYESLLEVINSSLQSDPTGLSATSKLVDETRRDVLDELTFRAATAQELSPNDIPTIFQRTGNFPQFLETRTWLVRGAKGTGKSLLWRLFIEQSNHARNIAQPEIDLRHVLFVPAHGREEVSPTLLNSNDLQSYAQQVGTTHWGAFWQYYALLQLYAALPELQSDIPRDDLVALYQTKQPSHSDILSWIIGQIQSPMALSSVGDALRQVDQWLLTKNQTVWLFYDELDIAFQTETMRCSALESLFAWWVESAPSYKCIVPKILLREDIWQTLNFPNKSHITGRNIQLRWDEADLWRLVLRQALVSPTYAGLIKPSISTKEVDSIELAGLRKMLFPLWGERMGRGKRAYTYNWVRNRMSDGNNNVFPRSVMVLLQQAIKLEKQYAAGSVYESIVRPKALTDALPVASQQRVDEIQEEYPELAPYLDKLRKQRSPLEKTKLSEIWREQDIDDIIKKMIKAGALQAYGQGKLPDASRYAVTDLYLYGLEMIRKGQQ